jgi:hypothetical protein
MAARRTDRLTFEPLVPSPLDYIGLRRFVFYPRIRNLEPNEWTLGVGSWTEVQVVNACTGQEIWIPRQYIGAVSESTGRMLTVGLRKELEYRAGILEPCIKRVIEMPQNPDEAPSSAEARERRTEGPAPVVGIRVENREDSPMNKALLAFGIAFIISFLAFAISVLTRA